MLFQQLPKEAGEDIKLDVNQRFNIKQHRLLKILFINHIGRNDNRLFHNNPQHSFGARRRGQ